MIDTHAHLDDDRFRDDLPAVLERPSPPGWSKFSPSASMLLRAGLRCNWLRPIRSCVPLSGFSRTMSPTVAPGDWEAILELVKHPIVVGIGETGLDRYLDRHRFLCRKNIFCAVSN